MVGLVRELQIPFQEFCGALLPLGIRGSRLFEVDAVHTKERDQ
jgi:hypothetical protein